MGTLIGCVVFFGTVEAVRLMRVVGGVVTYCSDDCTGKNSGVRRLWCSDHPDE